MSPSAHQRRIDASGLQFLQELEGLQNGAYCDSGGQLTIGIGHLLTPSERHSGKIVLGGEGVPYRHGLTDDQCRSLLRQDLEPVEDAINSTVEVPLIQRQYNALVAFVLNVGVNAFLKSTLLRLLNQGHYSEVPPQLLRWVMDNGRVVPGLVNRRHREIAMWMQKG